MYVKSFTLSGRILPPSRWAHKDVLLVVVIVVVRPGALRRGERPEIVVSWQQLLLARRCGECGGRRAEDTNLHNACTERISRSFTLLATDEMVKKIESNDDHRSVKPLRVETGLQEHPILIVSREGVYAMGWDEFGQRLPGVGVGSWPVPGLIHFCE